MFLHFQNQIDLQTIFFRFLLYYIRQFHKIESGLTELETIIPESGFCVGAFFTIADIAIVATVEYLSMRFEELRIREKFPRLASFSDFHGDRPSFKNTIPTPQQLNANVV